MINNMQTGEKKKHTLRNIFIMFVVMFVLMAIFLSDDDGNETTAPALSETKDNPVESGKSNLEKSNDDLQENTSTTASPETNIGIDAVTPDSPDYNKYLHVGRSYKLTNNVDMEILEAGFGYGIVYVLVEMTNNGDQDVYYDQSCARLYVDDYEVPDGGGTQAAISNGYIFVSGNKSYLTAARANAGGRKASLVFVADIPNNISDTSEVEFEILGAVFKINPLVTDQAQSFPLRLLTAA